MRKRIALLLVLAGCRHANLAPLPAIEVSGRPALQWTMAARMAHYHVPGVSVAVADHGRIVRAEGFGDHITTSTMFQAASVSKVIAATATLRLADQGKLDLDADVNRVLRSWKVPENEFIAREKVTLRRILSHTAGLTVHGFRGYKPGGPMPTIVQVLDGQPPAANAPVRVVSVPGSVTNYSGGGITIEQLVLTDVTQRPFPELMNELVLAPLGMRDSTFAAPSNPALGHDADGNVIDGGWAIGPEMAAGWLWTTPSDLLRWAIAIDAARDGKANAILSKRMAAEMLTAQKDQYGLGPLLEGSGRAFRFGHGGNNAGYRAQVTYFPETGQGAAIMVNGEGGDFLIDEIMRAIASHYDWPDLKPQTVTAIALSDTALANVTGDYDLFFPGASKAAPMRITSDSARLIVNVPPVINDDEVVALSATEFVSVALGYRMRLDANGLTLTYGQAEMHATRARR